MIIISAPIIAFYLFAGRTLDSDTGRQLSWIAAASQAFAVLLCVVALVIGALRADRRRHLRGDRAHPALRRARPTKPTGQS